MKALFCAVLALTATLVTMADADAANLVNEDSKHYSVRFTCDGASTTVSIRARTVHEDAFQNGCTIHITKHKRVRSLTVRKGGNVAIRGGRLVEG